jgi:energy-coupling factor transporter ATP-binding protein EcfA2
MANPDVSSEKAIYPHTWLFQSNPKIYDLIDELKNLQVGDEDSWRVNRYRSEMKPGDIVILWVSGQQAGIYALGELTDEPKNENGEVWVSYRYTHILDTPISRDTIKAHPILHNMQIIRMPQGTNFRVTDEEWNVLQTLLAGGQDLPRIWKISAGARGKDWPEFEASGLIGISFEGHWQGDLNQFDSHDELLNAVQQQAGKNAKVKYLADQLWNMSREMSAGDIVLAYGNGAFRGLGHVTGPYQFQKAPDFLYPHQRQVRWDPDFTTLSIAHLSQPLRQKLTSLKTIIPLTQEEYEEIIGSKSVTGLSGEDFNLLTALSDYVAAQGFHFPPGLLATFVTSLQTKGFIILSGLSGTGKTKLAQILADLLPRPRETTPASEETTEEGDIYIQVQPYMLKYARMIIPKSAWPLIDVPPEGETAEITVNFDSKRHTCRLVHAHYSGTYLQLLLRGQAREWFSTNFSAGDTLILQPKSSDDDNEFTGFDLLKRPPKPPNQQARLPNHIFVSVRPDWRDNKSLLGYYNPLTDLYNDTHFLQFLLQAKTHYDLAGPEALPHFVILDEMNLARVEYYFADFLSVLESGRDPDQKGYTREVIALHNHDPNGTVNERGRPIPQHIALPPNLYIVGTVNMDETTHAFSPKVLDRAFTIEFNEVDLKTYLDNTNDVFDEHQKDRLQQILLAGFQREGRFAQIDKTEIADFIQELPDYRDQLHFLNEALFTYDLHFGYRVFDEIIQFMAVAEGNGLFDDLDTAFDLAVLMKVLPKFNGPRSRLRWPLEIVVAWAKNPDFGRRQDVADQLRSADMCRELLTQLTTGFAYPETARKAIRMLIRLHETGFASFA